MMKTFLRRGWPPLTLIIIMLGALYCGYRFWEDSIRSQLVASFTNVGFTFMLACITWIYVLANKDLLNLMRQQRLDERQVHLFFGTEVVSGMLNIWISNLGTCHFMVSNVRVRTSAGVKRDFPCHTVVPPGQEGRISFGMKDLEPANITGDLDVQLSYRGPGSLEKESQITSAQGYNLLITRGSLEFVREGLFEVRSVRCPMCKQAVLMNPEGLHNEDEVFARQKHFEGELVATCENHRSLHLAKPA